MKKLQKGFTLIELMIVVAIIAILAAVAAPKFGEQIKKSKNAKGIQIIGTWRSSNTLYYSDNDAYITNTAIAFVSGSGLTKYVDGGTIAKTALGTNTATIQVGYASTPTDKTTVTMTYSYTNAEGSIAVTGGDMKASGATATDKWEVQ